MNSISYLPGADSYQLRYSGKEQKAIKKEKSFSSVASGETPVGEKTLCLHVLLRYFFLPHPSYKCTHFGLGNEG
jgi:hypothetical protein